MRSACCWLVALVCLSGFAVGGCDSGNPGVAGDASSGLQFQFSPKWQAGPAKAVQNPNAFETSSIILQCDVDTCATPAQILVQTATVGDLIEDERYSQSGTIDTDAGVRRLFERTSGYRLNGDYRRVQRGNLYGFRVLATFRDPKGLDHPLASEFLIRDRHMICVTIALMPNGNQNDAQTASAVLDTELAGLRIDGQPMEN